MTKEERQELAKVLEKISKALDDVLLEHDLKIMQLRKTAAELKAELKKTAR